MNFLNKKPAAALIMSLVILASLILIAQMPVFEAFVVCGILLAVCILVDIVVGTKALTKMQSRLAAIAIGSVAIAGTVIFGMVTGTKAPDTDTASPQNPSASQNAESPANTAPETTEGDEKPTDEMYELGLFYYEREEYEKAIETLSGVKVASDYYNQAQETLAEAVNLYRAGLIETADAYVEKTDYKLAIDVLSAGLLVIPQDAELTRMIEENTAIYNNLLREDAINKAQECAANEQFENAALIIEEYIEQLGGDDDIFSLYNMYHALAEVQLPDWYVFEEVVVKGNQMCFSRRNSVKWGEETYSSSVTVFSADENGSIYDVRTFEILDSVILGTVA